MVPRAIEPDLTGKAHVMYGQHYAASWTCCVRAANRMLATACFAGCVAVASPLASAQQNPDLLERIGSLFGDAFGADGEAVEV